MTESGGNSSEREAKQKAEEPDIDNISEKVLKKIEAENPKSLEGIPEEKKQEIVREIIGELYESGPEMISFRRSMFFGPMPPPEMLARYNEIHKGFAEALLVDFIDQGKHRRSLEDKAITGQLMESRRGQIFAFVLSIILFLIGGALIFYNQDLASGLSVIAASMVTLIGLHLQGKRQQRKDLEEKE